MKHYGYLLDKSDFRKEWQEDPDIEVYCRSSVACGTSRSTQPNLPQPSLLPTILPSSNYTNNTIIQQAIEEEGLPVALILLSYALVFVLLVSVIMYWKRKR